MGTFRYRPQVGDLGANQSGGSEALVDAAATYTSVPGGIAGEPLLGALALEGFGPGAQANRRLVETPACRDSLLEAADAS